MAKADQKHDFIMYAMCMQCVFKIISMCIQCVFNVYSRSYQALEADNCRISIDIMVVPTKLNVKNMISICFQCVFNVYLRSYQALELTLLKFQHGNGLQRWCQISLM